MTDRDDRAAIERVVMTLARSQDDRDTRAYAACLADPVLIHMPTIPGWQPAQVAAEEWAARAIAILSEFDVTQHALFNCLVDVDGDAATCDVDMRALHLKGEASLTIGGRYSLRLARSGHDWLITERSLDIRYQLGDESLMTSAIQRADERAQAEGSTTGEDSTH